MDEPETHHVLPKTIPVFDEYPDRHLFKKYIPIIKRIAEAGWEPVTYAKTDNEALYTERYGPDENGNVYITVLNDSKEDQQGILKVTLPVKMQETLVDIVSQKEIKFDITDKGLSVELHLTPEQVMAFDLTTR